MTFTYTTDEDEKCTWSLDEVVRLTDEDELTWMTWPPNKYVLAGFPTNTGMLILDYMTISEGFYSGLVYHRLNPAEYDKLLDAVTRQNDRYPLICFFDRLHPPFAQEEHSG